MPRRRTPPPHAQRGEFTIARIVLLCLILMLMLVVPAWWSKDRNNKADAREAAERALSAGPAPSAPAAAVHVNDPDRFGLTFGWVAAPTPDQLHASCHGEPREVGNPHRNSCNPYAGDTSCRTELPLLCARRSPGEPAMALGTSSRVVGFLLTSREAGDAQCAKDLGTGWQMASFHGGGGWEMRGARPNAVAIESQRRAWVFIGDQRGNCWDTPP